MTAGRGVLVTGGSRGIGAAIARAFAARGDRVAVHYRDATD
ncbi:MAG: SDR family NAD(P)-dependent oxidoreductase, partial [Trebonia sp.]